ncbi:(d)CMP kinase [Arthrobacter sp. Br18]|uniref:(d)CMP kinase n=1 Tax=Arthrobacter sp. Br18 TaxID=1312954 RepID=UPI0004B34E05|nr:(d)CMP kinase [Arthrobacter sp. Br18]
MSDSRPLSQFRLGKSLVVAIDGPSGSGKSSVSREVARRLHAAYLDTGAMYRAVTLHCLARGVDLQHAVSVEHAARSVNLFISTNPNHESVTLAGEDITEAIRAPAVSSAVSAVATTMGARDELIRRQRALIAGAGHRIVAEGRDITTVVAPDAEVRILLTASEEARLRRRGDQLGGSQSEGQLKQQVLERDARDSTVVNFQQAADGVVTVDSSTLDFEQTVSAVLDVVRTVAH